MNCAKHNYANTPPCPMCYGEFLEGEGIAEHIRAEKVDKAYLLRFYVDTSAYHFNERKGEYWKHRSDVEQRVKVLEAYARELGFEATDHKIEEIDLR